MNLDDPIVRTSVHEAWHAVIHHYFGARLEKFRVFDPTTRTNIRISACAYKSLGTGQPLFYEAQTHMSCIFLPQLLVPCLLKPGGARVARCLRHRYLVLARPFVDFGTSFLRNMP